MRSKKSELLEEALVVWFRPLPHLPTNARKWMAINIWWLSIFGVITLIICNILLAYLVIELLDFNIINLNSISILATLVLTLISLVVLLLSIKPLKELRKTGWWFLFIVLVINLLIIIIGSVLSSNMAEAIIDILRGSIGIVITSYLLFEVRSFFSAK